MGSVVTGRAATTPPTPPSQGGEKAQRNRDENAACARPTFHQPSQGLPFPYLPGHWPDTADHIASGPRSPVRMRMPFSRGRMKILPSPMLPSGPLRPASRMAFIVGSTKILVHRNLDPALSQ